MVNYVDEDEDNRKIIQVKVMVDPGNPHAVYGTTTGNVVNDDGSLAPEMGVSSALFKNYNFDSSKMSETYPDGTVEQGESDGRFELIRNTEAGATYTIQLTHKITPGEANATQTINYVYADGSPASKSTTTSVPFTIQTDEVLKAAGQDTYTKKRWYSPAASHLYKHE
ncbi:mucin-binding protein [Lacticaseibacillus pantheris]|uniref:mucin-binding protein n=1 Tax=Lacticaseibacillus pantheris TaxID=171523 RepID=UPI0006D022D3|nr:hypothetical protein [Lacticaseibacillus pantheris]